MAAKAFNYDKFPNVVHALDAWREDRLSWDTYFDDRSLTPQEQEVLYTAAGFDGDLALAREVVAHFDDTISSLHHLRSAWACLEQSKNLAKEPDRRQLIEETSDRLDGNSVMKLIGVAVAKKEIEMIRFLAELAARKHYRYHEGTVSAWHVGNSNDMRIVLALTPLLKKPWDFERVVFSALMEDHYDFAERVFDLTVERVLADPSGEKDGHNTLIVTARILIEVMGDHALAHYHQQAEPLLKKVFSYFFEHSPTSVDMLRDQQIKKINQSWSEEDKLVAQQNLDAIQHLQVCWARDGLLAEIGFDAIDQKPSSLAKKM